MSDTVSKGGGKARRIKLYFDMAPRYFKEVYFKHNNKTYGTRKLIFIEEFNAGKTKYSTKKAGGDCPREFPISHFFAKQKPYAQGHAMQYTMYNVDIEYEFTNCSGKFKLECDIAWRIGPELRWQKLNATLDTL